MFAEGSQGLDSTVEGFGVPVECALGKTVNRSLAHGLHGLIIQRETNVGCWASARTCKNEQVDRTLHALPTLGPVSMYGQCLTLSTHSTSTWNVAHEALHTRN